MMDALLVFAVHYAHPDRDVSDMAKLRMLSKQVTNAIDMKYPGYVSDLKAVIVAQKKARTDKMLAAFEAVTEEDNLFEHNCNLKSAIRTSGLLEQKWPEEDRPLILDWLRKEFCDDNDDMHSIDLCNMMYAFGFDPVELVTHSGEFPTKFELCNTGKYVPKNALPRGAVFRDVLLGDDCPIEQYTLRVCS